MDSTPQPRIGLALGGGGARGLAHIAMLEVFDEMGIKPSMIAGCSMGALIGACYAAGMSAGELRVHAVQLLSNRVEFARYVFGARKVNPLHFLSLRGAASLHLSGERLADIAIPDRLPRYIEDTPIPIKIIACDYERMEEAVLTSGLLTRAVGASIAIPGLIAAPEINGRVHVDGGVVNPVPFDQVRDGMDFVVAIDVTGRPAGARNGRASNLDMAIGSLLIMFNRLAELKRALSPPDIYLVPKVDQFGSTDFFRVRDILASAEPAKEDLRRRLERLTQSMPAALLTGDDTREG